MLYFFFCLIPVSSREFVLTEILHSIQKRPEENTTAYILWSLSEAKLAYPTAWAMGEEGKVVSFLKGFTDRAFDGHLLGTVQAEQAEQQQSWPWRRRINQ